MNVLLTSSGRRTYLVDYFKKALNGKGLVFAANSCESPALLRADGAVITPLIYSDEYIPFLLDFCKKNEIGLLVPLFDIDLPVLSAHRKEFSEIGTVVAVSGPDVIAVCNDKYRMYEALTGAGIAVPGTWLSAEEVLSENKEWPVLIKPRFGMGSIGVLWASSEEELRVLSGICERNIRESYLRYEAAQVPGQAVIFEKAALGDEYGLDVINDFSGSFCTVIVKKKAAMRSGETDEAVTLGKGDPFYEELFAIGRKLSETFRHRGNLDVDVRLDTDGRIPYVIDMNARFGGGYPFSHAAGVDLPLAYVLWAEGREAPKELFAARAGVHCYKDISISMVQ